MNSARTLLTSLVDYAGLFPPAELQMRSAVPRYASHRAGPHAWMLGRFVLPLDKLEEFEHVFDDVPARERATPWGLAVLGGRSLDADVRKIVDFNRRHGDDGRQDARIESIDLKVHSLEDIARAADVLSEPAEVYFEIAIGSDPRERLSAVAAAGGRAKVRTGGVSADMFPAVADLARFLAVAAVEGVPFKATAGLHHPLPAERTVGHDGHGTRVMMHGFLNLFVAAALAYVERADVAALEAVLGEQSASAFAFDDEGIAVHGRRMTCDGVRQARRRFALSYGSCSIDEPIDELTALRLI